MAEKAALAIQYTHRAAGNMKPIHTVISGNRYIIILLCPFMVLELAFMETMLITSCSAAAIKGMISRPHTGQPPPGNWLIT